MEERLNSRPWHGRCFRLEGRGSVWGVFRKALRRREVRNASEEVKKASVTKSWGNLGERIDGASQEKWNNFNSLTSLSLDFIFEICMV